MPRASRAIAAVFATDWLIEPKALRAIAAIVQRQDPLVAGLPDMPEEETRRRLQIVDGVAAHPIVGPIMPRANMMTEFSGATSFDILQSGFFAAEESNQVNAHVLDFATPGSTVNRTQETSRIIGNLKKPTVAFIRENASSGGYWLATQCDLMIIEAAAHVGSIGVVASLVVQESPDQHGEIEVEIVSSNAPLKRPDPRTEEGRAAVLDVIDGIEALFINDVAAGRNRSVEEVLETFGRGNVVNGGPAVALGMADRLGDEASAFAEARAMARPSTSVALSQSASSNLAAIRETQATLAALGTGETGGPADPGVTVDKRSSTMTTKTAEQLAQENPQAVESIRAAAKAEALKEQEAAQEAAAAEARDAALKEGQAAGAEAERQRIAGLKAGCLPGYEDLLAECIADGTSTAQDLAFKIVQKKQAAGDNHLSSLAAGERALSDNLPATGAGAQGAAEGPSGLPAGGGEEEWVSAWASDAKLRGQFQSKEDYLAYMRADAKGRSGALRGAPPRSLSASGNSTADMVPLQI